MSVPHHSILAPPGSLNYFIDRRSQLMCSTDRVVPVGLSTDDEPSTEDDDEEASHPGTRTPQGDFVGDRDWDDDVPFIPTYSSLQQPVQAPASRGHGNVDERSPLLSRVSEQSTAPPSSVPPKSYPIGQSTFSQTVSRPRLPVLSKVYVLGQVFNATALLLGIGMLSEPLAYSYAGWICGTLLIIGYGMITCYTYVTVVGVFTFSLTLSTFLEGRNFWRAL